MLDYFLCISGALILDKNGGTVFSKCIDYIYKLSLYLSKSLIINFFLFGYALFKLLKNFQLLLDIGICTDLR